MSLRFKARRLSFEVLEDKRLLSVSTFDLENEIGKSSEVVQFCGVVDGHAIISARRRNSDDFSTLWSVSKSGEVTAIESPAPDCSRERDAATENDLYFEASQWPIEEIWKTNGTPEGTERVLENAEELVDGEFAVTSRGLIGIGHGDTAEPGRGTHYLWLFEEGEGSAPEVIKEFDDDETFFRLVYELDGLIFFARARYFPGDSPNELWVTDGTADGTKLLRDDYDGSPGNDLSGVEFDGRFFLPDPNPRDDMGLSALEYDPLSGQFDSAHPFVEIVADGSTMYYTDSSRDIWQQSSGDAEPQYVGRAFSTSMYLTDGRLFYFGPDTEREGGGDAALWTKGPEDSEAVRLGPTQFTIHNDVVPINGRLAYRSATTEGSSVQSLWVSDGTPSGTIEVRTSPSFGLQAFEDEWIFRTWDAPSGTEYWITDGTTAGTHLFVDLDPATQSSFPRSFYEVDDEVRFTAGSRLWASNSASERPILVHDFEPDRDPQSYDGRFPSGVSKIFSANEQRFAVDSSNIWEEVAGEFVSLVESDLRIQDTDILSDGTLFYLSNTTTVGVRDLHAVDPSEGISVIRSIEADYRWGASLGDQFVFLVGQSDANSNDVNYSVFGSDGTSAGTTLLREFSGDSAWPGFEHVVVDDQVWFPIGDKELWRSDGTPAGTYRVYDVPFRFHDFVPSTIQGDLLFFQQTDLGFELRASDGTPGETTLLADLGRGWPFSNRPWGPATAANTGDFVYFFTRETGAEENQATMWRTDGTAENTLRIADGLPFLSADNIVKYQGDIFFSATTGSEGKELWKLDSDKNSVERVADLVPGSQGSNPLELFATPRGIYFQHDSEDFGVELGIYAADDALWHNGSEPTDVNQDGEVTPLDALHVINELNARQVTDSRFGRLLAAARPLFAIDVNDDILATPLDALVIINELNSQGTQALSSSPSSSTTLPLALTLAPNANDAFFAVSFHDEEE